MDSQGFTGPRQGSLLTPAADSTRESMSEWASSVFHWLRLARVGEMSNSATMSAVVVDPADKCNAVTRTRELQIFQRFSNLDLAWAS